MEFSNFFELEILKQNGVRDDEGEGDNDKIRKNKIHN